MFIAGIATVLAEYPPELHAIAVMPGGIPRRVKALRNLAEIDEVCRILFAPIVRRIEREAIANQPRVLARGPRSEAEQAHIDHQVARVRKSFGLAP